MKSEILGETRNFSVLFSVFQCLKKKNSDFISVYRTEIFGFSVFVSVYHREKKKSQCLSVFISIFKTLSVSPPFADPLYCVCCGFFLSFFGSVENVKFQLQTRLST